MLRIAICDDETIFLEKMRNALERISEHLGYETKIRMFSSGLTFLEACTAERFHLVFLDIDMPDISGFEAAQKINTEDVLIVFCSNHNELVYDSFQYQPFWFLCKNNFEDQLESVVRSAGRKIALGRTCYPFHVNGEIVNIPVEDIIYLEVFKHKIFVYVKGGDTVSFRGSIGVMEKELQRYRFARVNTGCIANLSAVRHIRQSEIVLEGGAVVALSRGKRKDFIDQFHEFMREKR